MNKADAFEVALKLLGVYVAWRFLQSALWGVAQLMEAIPAGGVAQPAWRQTVVLAIAMIVLIGYGRRIAVWLAGRQEEASDAPALPGARLGFWIAVLGVYLIVRAWMTMIWIPRHWRDVWEIAGLAVSFAPGIAMLLWGHTIGGWIEARWARKSPSASAEGR